MMPHHWTNTCCPEPPPNTRVQLTACGARGRWQFDSFRSASAAAEAQDVIPPSTSVVVVAGLCKFHAVAENLVHQAVDVTDSPRPDIVAEVFQVLRFADAAEWIAHGGLHQVKYP